VGGRWGRRIMATLIISIGRYGYYYHYDYYLYHHAAALVLSFLKYS